MFFYMFFVKKNCDKFFLSTKSCIYGSLFLLAFMKFEEFCICMSYCYPKDRFCSDVDYIWSYLYLKIQIRLEFEDYIYLFLLYLYPT